jgi:hypothetical protein
LAADVDWSQESHESRTLLLDLFDGVQKRRGDGVDILFQLLEVRVVEFHHVMRVDETVERLEDRGTASSCRERRREGSR